MRNTIIFAAILFIATIVATIFYFKNLNGEHSQSTKSLRFLPDNTLIIAAIGNDKESENIFNNFEIFDAVLGFENTKIWQTFKTKLLNNEAVKQFTNGSDIFISFHPEKKEIVTLFTIPTTQSVPNADLTVVLNAISSNYKTKTIDTLGNKIYQIQYGEKDSILNAIYFNDIFFASPSLNLLTKIMDKHAKHLSDEQIDFFLKDNPRSTPLSIYFPHQQYDSLINITQKSTNGPFIDLFKKLQGQSAWNINFKEDALILTGESKLDEYPDNYASLFKNQQKQKQQLYKYFPSNTAVYAEFSISDPISFQKDLQKLFKRRTEKVAEEIETDNTNELLNQVLGNNYAFLETNDQNYIGLIQLKDINKIKELKTKILESEIDSIGRFAKSGTLYKQYGDAFKELSRPYYTIIDSVMIVANSSSTLKKYRKDYFSNDLLTGTLGFIKLEKLQGNEANITLFAHSKNVNSKILNALNQQFREKYKDDEKYGYQDFFSWSIQLSGNNGKIASQIYAIYKSTNILGTTPEWTLQLDERAITRPYVFEQSDTSQFILIQELDHTIHAISPTGTKIWSKVIAGRVVGEIQQTEDRSIILVTDKSNLYKFDTKGEIAKGYPIKLPTKPITTPTLVNQKSILVPNENYISAYTLNGDSVVGWYRYKVDGTITTAILSKDKTYIVGTSNGFVYWFDENGKKIDHIKINTAVKDIATIDKYKIAVLDNEGGLNLFTDDSKSKRIKLTDDSNNYFSLFANITNQNNNNLTVITGNELKVYTIQDTLKQDFAYNFTKPINDEIEYFKSVVNNNQFKLGVASKATNLIYLFDESGQLVEGFPTEGRPLFYYGKVNYNSDVYLLCLRRDHKLYAFRQKK